MLTTVVRRITDSMEVSGAFTSDDREIYEYGIHQSLFMLLNLVTIALVGLVLGTVWHMMFFVLAFAPLRSFAGGYHAKSKLGCYVATTAMAVLVSLLPSWITIGNITTAGILLIFGAVICLLSPTECENKPLDDLEKKVYKRRAIVICAFLVMVALTFLLLGTGIIVEGIFWALAMVLLLLFLRRLQVIQGMFFRNVKH